MLPDSSFRLYLAQQPAALSTDAYWSASGVAGYLRSCQNTSTGVIISEPSAGFAMFVVQELVSRVSFERLFQVVVSRAYFKVISKAYFKRLFQVVVSRALLENLFQLVIS